MNRLQVGAFAGMLISTLLLGGCDLKEIYTFSTVVAIGIDQGHDDKIQLTMEISNFMKSKGNEQKTMIISGTGSSIVDAVKNIQLKSPLELYFAHTALILLGASYARHSIDELTDYLQRNLYFRPTMIITVCKDSAKDVLGAKISTETINAFGIREMIEEASQRSLTTGSEMIRGLKDLHHYSQTFRLAALTLGPDVEPEVVGEGLFQRGRLVRWISANKVPFQLLLTERHIGKQLISITFTDHQQLVMRILWATVSTQVSLQHGKLFVVYKVKGDSEIAESCCQMSFSSKKLVTIDKILNDTLRMQTQQMVRSLQVAHIDGIDLADVLFREHHRMYQLLSKNWDDHFANADISYQFAIRLIRTGLLS